MPKFTPHFLTEFVNDIDANGYTQRIKDLAVTAQPNAVLIKFRTTQLTVPVIEIFSLIHDTNGKLIQNTSNHITTRFDFVSAALGNYFSEHQCRINALAQETNYSFRITAGNGALSQAVTTGTFRTGKRSVSFTVRDLLVYNDGDGSGSGEMEFVYGFYNENNERLKDGPVYYSDIDSGEVRHPFDKQQVFQNDHAPDWMAIYVKGQDDDHFAYTPFHPWNNAPIKLPEQPSHDENDDWVNADAFQYLEFPNEPGIHRVQFFLDSGPWGIHFVTTGWADVEVTPPSVPAKISQSAKSIQYKPKFKTTVTLNGHGQQGVVQNANGGRSLLATGPNGMLAIRLPLEKFQRIHQWKIIQERGVDSATIVAADNGIHTFTISSGIVKHRFECLDDSKESSGWQELGEGFLAPITASPLPDGTIPLTALKQNGSLCGMFFQCDFSKSKWVNLGDRLSGVIKIISQKHDLDIFNLSSEGTIFTAKWHPESAGELYWQSIDSVPFNYIFVDEEDEVLHIIGVSGDRQVHHLSRVHSQWSPRWTSLGTLDDLNMEEEPVTEPAMEEVFA